MPDPEELPCEDPRELPDEPEEVPDEPEEVDPDPSGLDPVGLDTVGCGTAGVVLATEVAWVSANAIAEPPRVPAMASATNAEVTVLIRRYPSCGDCMSVLL